MRRSQTDRDPVLSAMRAILERVARPWSVGAARVLTLVVAVILGGAWLFSRTEHVSLFRAVYWAVTTASTVGYGDVVPTNRRAELVAMGMMVLAVPLLGLTLANVASGLVEGRLKKVLGLSIHKLPRGFVLVLGWSPLGVVAVRDLLRRGDEVLVVADVDALGIDDPHLRFLHGDPADQTVIASVHPERARAAILCHDHDGELLVSAIALHQLAPGLTQTAAPSRRSTAEALADLGILSGLPATDLLGFVLSRGSEAPHAGPLLWELVSDPAYVIAEIEPAAAEVGKAAGAIAGERSARGELLLGVIVGGRVRLPLGAAPIGADDHMLVLRRR